MKEAHNRFVEPVCLNKLPSPSSESYFISHLKVSLPSFPSPTLLRLFERVLKYAEAEERRVLSSVCNAGKGEKKATYVAIQESLAEKVLFCAWMKIKMEKNWLQQSLQLAKMAHLGASCDARLPIKPSECSGFNRSPSYRCEAGLRRIDQNELPGVENLHSLQ